jgi:predicted nucleotidyltransferase
VTFAVSRFLRPDRVIAAIREAVAGLESRHAAIEAVYLFGSLASGTPTPGSDIDLLVVTESLQREDLYPEFLSLPLPVDLHLVKPEEFRRLSSVGRGLPGVATRSGMRLL